MVALSGIAYVSSAVGEQSEEALEDLLLDARQFNHEVGVTGVLLHDEGNFFQYFEGPVDGVREVYNRILKATRHRGIFELFGGTVVRRHFSDWVMGFARAPHSQILKLSQAQWKSVAATLPQGKQAPAGVALLADHWRAIARMA
ncbi:BLUF domain-containing protein [Pseudorhodoferax soli]|uniref:FAD-dependent sensor of blue light n=1 Tax=Pseudorhodoferax soli TaxID=545864 RepID=A0A368XJN7_9BURK|nr:BLUF domain-containing protein [Pseudorhodoferax soli]RCW66244.1 FAD-dependent sensor of blue light [Pseudorhodoferax soli]